MRTAQLVTADGHHLDADVAGPPDDAPVHGGVVVCHPHPLYGGNRFNPVVDAVFAALSAAGFVTLRFDFRSDHGDGVAERLDVVAALDTVAHDLAGRGAVDAPLAVVGYSFGAVVALSTDDDRIAACAAIAPPLAMTAPPPPPSRPTLVLSPRHDQFCDPDAAAVATADWPDTDRSVVESADHFLAGRTRAVAEQVVAWLTARAT